ncbi:MAG TPA: hypothetical protein DEF61_04570 [Firmicutes bacterium]|nr:hypothetical protein [Bacillota bacterium]HBX25504.1 hypothetical protein [Bacillota bacterium]
MPFKTDDNKGMPSNNRKTLKYVLYILIVLIATVVSLTLSLWGQFDAVVSSFAGADWIYLLVILGMIFLSYCIDGVIIWAFCRLYTRNYKFHQGLAASYVGQFYSDITPGASGGQVMQVYTLKSQGIQVSNAASIMVMWFILYQIALIGFDVLSICFEWSQIMNIKSLDLMLFGSQISFPMLPLIIVGFVLNVSVIFLLLAMSYSHRFHNFILHHVIGFLGKIKLIKKPDRTRENLRVHVENFKIELRRLQSNVPIVILQLILFSIMIFLRNSVPYIAGLALHSFGETASFDIKLFFDSAFLSSFHQMVTGLIPLPGSAGVSELFYQFLFYNFFNGNQAYISSTLILWRTATFHIPLLASGLVSALYRSRPKEPIHYANRQTFVNIQLETFAERKRSADTLYETRQLSRKAIQEKIAENSIFKPRKAKPNNLPIDENENVIKQIEKMEPNLKQKEKSQKVKIEKVRKQKKKIESEEDEMQRWDL